VRGGTRWVAAAVAAGVILGIVGEHVTERLRGTRVRRAYQAPAVQVVALLNDTDIGQKLEPIASAVDYLSPMLYPSGFQFGIPGFRNPVQNPYEIVYLSLKKAQERTKISPLRFRPWLQAFKDYAFDRRQFNGKELRDQISASEKFGSQGWMLWNPVNQYTAAAESLKKDIKTASVGPVASNP